MARYVPLIAILVLCSSCVYQRNILRSRVEIPKEELTKGTPFTFETDSARFQYSFKRGNVNISIYNKTKNPLFVDWNSSSLIVNGEAFTMFIGKSDVKIKVTKRQYGYGYSGMRGIGRITTSYPIASIPPDSKITITPLNITRLTPPIGDGKKMESEIYTEETSPFKMRSYLVLSDARDFSKLIKFDHHFWAGEVVQFNNNPQAGPRADTYDIKRKKKR